MKPFEAHGFWWLPGNEKKCAGVLQCNEDGQLRLFLYGALFDFRQALEHSGRFPIAFGEITRLSSDKQEPPKGSKVTLFDGYVSSSHIGENHTQTLFAHRGVFGDTHVSPNERFTSVRLLLSGAASWASDLTTIAGDSATVSDQIASITWRWKAEPITVAFPRGRITISTLISSSHQARERTVRERVWFSAYYNDAVPMDVLEGDVYALQNFLTFATDHPNTITKYEVRQEAGGKFGGLQVVGPTVFDDEKVASELLPHDMLFSLPNVAERFPELISRWFQIVESRRPAILVYFGLKYAQPGYAEVRFQQIAQAVSLYRSAAVSLPVNELLQSTERGDLVNAKQVQADLLGTHPLVMFQTALDGLIRECPQALDPLANGNRNACVSVLVDALAQAMYGLRKETHTQFHWLVEVTGFFWKVAVLVELGFAPDELLHLLRQNRMYRHLQHNIAPQLFPSS
ncbi:hypothetical protein R5W24_003029 [Gemmata sp. JC717]|uniref:ApeA N-terminal domain 1-containing protein n=1 Tax=Gemmata algarum TaxID=2975278 RepID=UPI0021BAB457|nr:hypothetical protein [Gemmata algarum]MDY3553915.1 hypothetical protein [Gemmata algarum]